jgi:hypothetical protein
MITALMALMTGRMASIVFRKNWVRGVQRQYVYLLAARCARALHEHRPAQGMPGA